MNVKYVVDGTVPVTRKLFGMDRNHPKVVNDEIVAVPNSKHEGKNVRRKDKCKNNILCKYYQRVGVRVGEMEHSKTLGIAGPSVRPDSPHCAIALVSMT